MKRTTKIALAVGAALSLGLGVAAVSAHPPYGAGSDSGYGPHGYGMGSGWGMHGYGMGPQSMFAPGAAEGRIAGLKAELGITAKQEAAWQAFVKSTQQRDESRQAWFAKMREARAAGTLPELLEQQDEMIKQHQAQRQAATSALKALYAELTPEQKTIADQRLGGFGPGYGRGYGGRFR